MIFALAFAVGATIDPSSAAITTRADEVAASVAILTGDRLATSANRVAALDLLDRNGARPMTESDRAAVAAWRRQVRLKPIVWRGRMLGPAFRLGTLAPGEALEFAQVFTGGQSATVAVTSAPTNSVKLSITGVAGAPVCAGQSRCGWQPRFTERVNVRVANDALEPRRFVLVVD